MKQVIVVRQDLKLPKGKLAVQSAHASTEAALESNKNKLRKWRKQGSKKVVLKVKHEKELLSFYAKARKARLKSVLIRDAGKTVLEPGTITALAIGPDTEKRIDKLTGKLKMV
jgi:PTH2 family peptidyl-tRNA hydrolase